MRSIAVAAILVLLLAPGVVAVAKGRSFWPWYVRACSAYAAGWLLARISPGLLWTVMGAIVFGLVIAWIWDMTSIIAWRAGLLRKGLSHEAIDATLDTTLPALGSRLSRRAALMIAIVFVTAEALILLRF